MLKKASLFLVACILFFFSCQEKEQPAPKTKQEILEEKTKNHPINKLFEGKSEEEQQAIAESLFYHMLDTSKVVDSLKEWLSHQDNQYDSLNTMWEAIHQENRMVIEWWMTQKDSDWWEKNPTNFDESGNAYDILIFNPFSFALYAGKPEMADFINGKGFFIKFEYRHNVHAEAMDYYVQEMESRGIARDSLLDSLLHKPAKLSDTALVRKLLELGADPNSRLGKNNKRKEDPDWQYKTPMELAAEGPPKMFNDYPQKDSVIIELLAKHGARFDMLDSNGQYKVINALFSSMECNSGFECENSRFSRFMALRNIGVKFDRRSKGGNIFINQLRSKGYNLLYDKTLPYLLQDGVDTSAYTYRLVMDSCGYDKDDPKGFVLYQRIQSPGDENYVRETQSLFRAGIGTDQKYGLTGSEGILHDAYQPSYWCTENYVIHHGFFYSSIFHAPGTERSFDRLLMERSRWGIYNAKPEFYVFFKQFKDNDKNPTGKYEVNAVDLKTGKSLLKKDIEIGFNPMQEPPQLKYNDKHSGIAIRFLNDSGDEKIFKLKFQDSNPKL